jgi:hypothetical protein
VQVKSIIEEAWVAGGGWGVGQREITRAKREVYAQQGYLLKQFKAQRTSLRRALLTDPIPFRQQLRPLFLATTFKEVMASCFAG